MIIRRIQPGNTALAPAVYLGSGGSDPQLGIEVHMSVIRLLGIAMAVVGLFFLINGIHATDAPLEHLSETLTGKYSNQTALYIAGGIAALIVGGGLAVFAPRAHS